jgi:hypothetical protein
MVKVPFSEQWSVISGQWTVLVPLFSKREMPFLAEHLTVCLVAAGSVRRQPLITRSENGTTF